MSGCVTQNYQQILDSQKKKPLTSFAQQISCPVSNLTIGNGSARTLQLSVKNTGTQPWIIGRDGLEVDVGYRWQDESGNILPIESPRAVPSVSILQPGESSSVAIDVSAPPAAGHYTLLVSMVQEQVAWFFTKGASPLKINVNVD